MNQSIFDKEAYVQNFINFFAYFSQIYKSAKETYRKELFRFFEVLATQYRAIKKIEEEFNHCFAVNFNLIEIFRPDEVKLTRILAELLNPKGTHGQKETFLKLFVKKIYKNDITERIDYETAEIKIEFETAKGRIDLLIEFFDLSKKRKRAIAIENKPWAGEQENQLQRYADYLKDRYQDYLLVFLSTEGRAPKTLNEREELEKEGKFLIISYDKFLKDWLKECVRFCEAEKVRIFLKDLIAWIEKHF